MSKKFDPSVFLTKNIKHKVTKKTKLDLDFAFFVTLCLILPYLQN
jgi:hypothetical protein